MDLEEDYAGELEGLDISACKEKIRILQAARERRREAVERLQEKLKALNYELAARKEEAEKHKKAWQDQVERNRRSAGDSAEGGQLALGDFSAADVDDVRRLIEQHLSNAVPTHAERNELGLRLFDERDLMVERPPTRGGAGEALRVDTVLITHYRSASSELKYFLSYRVGRDTTVRKLREDACAYWGLSEVEYILWTMTNCKVQDDLVIQSLFKPHEEAHLILAPKTPKKVEPPERIVELIRAKVGPKARPAGRRRQGAAAPSAEVAAVDEARRRPGNFYEQMAEVRGLFEFMTQRDRNVVDHLKRVRCCTLFLYLLLTLLGLIALFMVKPPDKEYFCRTGVLDALMYGGPKAFDRIETRDEVWAWLQAVVPGQFFDETSALRQSNVVVGSLAIWMQQVSDASASRCDERVPGGVACMAETYGPKTAEKGDLQAVKLYWEPLDGLDGRVNGTVPWRYLDAEAGEAAGAFAEAGRLRGYDASGYLLAYDLRHNSTATYDAAVQDLAELRRLDWISHRTRALHLHFGLYNMNYDYWISSWYMFEFPLSGLVWPNYEVDVHRPVFDASTHVGIDNLVLDSIRFGLVVFLFFAEILPQSMYKAMKVAKSKDAGPKREKTPGRCKSLCLYLLSWRGLLDFAVLGLFFAVFVVRYLAGPLHNLSSSFHNTSAKAVNAVSRINILLEALLFGICCVRVLSLLQLNRYVYVLWKTLGSAARRYMAFALVLLPVIVGFVVLAQAVWRSYSVGHRTFWASTTSVLMALVGDPDALLVDTATRPVTTIFTMVFYTGLVIFVINLWAAVLINQYQSVRVASGFRPQDYKWTEYDYGKWCMPKLIFEKAYLKVRPHIRPPSDDEDEGT